MPPISLMFGQDSETIKTILTDLNKAADNKGKLSLSELIKLSDVVSSMIQLEVGALLDE